MAVKNRTPPPAMCRGSIPQTFVQRMDLPPLSVSKPDLNFDFPTNSQNSKKPRNRIAPGLFRSSSRTKHPSQDQHRIPHTDGSRDAGMESSENASIFKAQECHWFRLEFCLCIQRVFVSVQQKSPVWGLFVRYSATYLYINRCLPIMQLLFGRHQRPSVKLTPAKSSDVKT